MTDPAREELAAWVAERCGWAFMEGHSALMQAACWIRDDGERPEDYDWLSPDAIFGPRGLVEVMRDEGWGFNMFDESCIWTCYVFRFGNDPADDCEFAGSGPDIGTAIAQAAWVAGE